MTKGRRRQKGDPEEPDDHALGRSRGGFSTKFHLHCDGQGLPLALRLTPGQTHESQVLDELLAMADERLLDDDGERFLGQCLVKRALSGRNVLCLSSRPEAARLDHAPID